jgi:osmotically-inducible protein OsmY
MNHQDDEQQYTPGQYERVCDPPLQPSATANDAREHSAGQEYDQQPHHQQRGPKGARLSDADLCEEIAERLMEALHIDSREVTAQVLGGKVLLEGTVPDRHMKHAIEALAAAAPGVQEVDNRIRVAGSGGPGPDVDLSGSSDQ